MKNGQLECQIFLPKYLIPYARHYKPRLVYFFTPFQKTIYVLWLLALCMAYIQERLLIKSGLWWRAYGRSNSLLTVGDTVKMQEETTFEKFSYQPNVTLCLQLNEYIFHQSKPKFDLDSLLIYVFCTSCVHKIVLSVLQIKRKTISSLWFWQNI